MYKRQVDTYADKNYRLLFDTEGEWYCNDARTIEPERMPDFDLLCAGSVSYTHLDVYKRQLGWLYLLRMLIIKQNILNP